MVSFFNKNRIFVIFFLPLLALLPGGFGIINAEPVNIPHSMPLFNIIRFVLPETPWFLSLLALLLILLISVLANNIVTSFELQKNTYVPALIYMLFSLSYKSYIFITPLLFSNLMILLLLYDIFNLGKEERSLDTVFRIGLLVGIASLIYAPTMGYLLLGLIGVSIYRSDILKEWLVIFTAFLIPWAFTLVFYFWFDKFNLILNVLSDSFRFDFLFVFDWKKSYFYLFFIPVFLMALIRFLSSTGYGNVKLRKNKMVVLWFVLITIVIYFFSGINWIDFMVLLALPVAVVITGFLISFRKSIVGEVFFWLFFIGITYNIFLSKFTIF